MSAFYIMRIQGETARSAGAIYIGKGLIVGVDTGEVRFDGTYTEVAGRLKASVLMTRPRSEPVALSADWPMAFTEAAQSLTVENRELKVTFEKLRDIP